jgi:hypothetical protein
LLSGETRNDLLASFTEWNALGFQVHEGHIGGAGIDAGLCLRDSRLEVFAPGGNGRELSRETPQPLCGCAKLYAMWWTVQLVRMNALTRGLAVASGGPLILERHRYAAEFGTGRLFTHSRTDGSSQILVFGPSIRPGGKPSRLIQLLRVARLLTIFRSFRSRKRRRGVVPTISPALGLII